MFRVLSRRGRDRFGSFLKVGSGFLLGLGFEDFCVTNVARSERFREFRISEISVETE